jgi:hypothetical protein
MNEEIKEVEMYCYFINGKEVWTSNEIFAEIRSNFYGSKLYVETVKVDE